MSSHIWMWKDVSLVSRSLVVHKTIDESRKPVCWLCGRQRLWIFSICLVASCARGGVATTPRRAISVRGLFSTWIYRYVWWSAWGSFLSSSLNFCLSLYHSLAVQLSVCLILSTNHHFYIYLSIYRSHIRQYSISLPPSLSPIIFVCVSVLHPPPATLRNKMNSADR